MTSNYDIHKSNDNETVPLFAEITFTQNSALCQPLDFFSSKSKQESEAVSGAIEAREREDRHSGLNLLERPLHKMDKYRALVKFYHVLDEA